MDENMNMPQDNPDREKQPSETAPLPPHQKCPRCDSANTKFCYYNNYSLTQPRYFCRGCRRYWTQGGTLRNVPVGGGCRKPKRPKTSGNNNGASSSNSAEMPRPTQPLPAMPRPLNFPGMGMGMDPGQGPRQAGFYAGGAILSSFTGMQTVTATGLTHQAGATLNAASSSVVGRYAAAAGANMGVLQFQTNTNGFFQQQQQQVPPMSSWSQGFANTGGSTVSNGGGGGGQMGGTSFNSNQWSSDVSYNNQGFNPHHH